MACEFEVFAITLCSTTIDLKAVLVVQERGSLQRWKVAHKFKD